MADQQKKKAQQSLRRRQIEKLRKLMLSLPPFCFDYFIGIESTTTLLTRINYAYDLRVFFDYLLKDIPYFQDKDMQALTVKDLEAITLTDLEMYLDYLNYYEKDEHEHENQERGKARKLASLRSFFKYYYRTQQISSNIVSLMVTPKIRDKAIIRLEPDEVARLLDSVETGTVLTDKQKQYHRYTKVRDVAILTVFLGTGVRISECTGLNISDIDFHNRCFKIIRKGGKEAIIYFGDEVNDALTHYLEQRREITTLPGHEDALFLSIQKRRMSNRSIQELVKKYASASTPLKKITPHKLRSTYGTSLYRETGDIYLVADVLGHSDVNTTRRHYAAIAEDQRRSAARAVVLRQSAHEQDGGSEIELDQNQDNKKGED